MALGLGLYHRMLRSALVVFLHFHMDADFVFTNICEDKNIFGIAGGEMISILLLLMLLHGVPNFWNPGCQNKQDNE